MIESLNNQAGHLLKMNSLHNLTTENVWVAGVMLEFSYNGLTIIKMIKWTCELYLTETMRRCHDIQVLRNRSGVPHLLLKGRFTFF